MLNSLEIHCRHNTFNVAVVFSCCNPDNPDLAILYISINNQSSSSFNETYNSLNITICEELNMQ